jgi:xyloglucan-specific endo-beta-1,4-glucanase
LFYGRNSGGTHVFTAVTKDNSDVLSFDEDFYPLFQYILEQAHKHIDADDLPKDPWLGIIEFGTETWMSRGNATFTAANFGMSLKGNFTGERNSTKQGDDDKDKGDKSGSEKGGYKGSGNNLTDSKGDEEDHAVRLMSQSVLGYVMAAALVISAVLS